MDAYIGRIAAVFDVLTMHDIGSHRAELGDKYLLAAGGTAHDLFCTMTSGDNNHMYSQPVSGYGAACSLVITKQEIKSHKNQLLSSHNLSYVKYQSLVLLVYA